MQRRARIKAVANLLNVRRGANKNTNSEHQQEGNNSKNDLKDKSIDSPENSTTLQKQNDDSILQEKSDQATSSAILNDDDVNKSIALPENLKEQSNQVDLNVGETSKETTSKNQENDADQDKQEKFKTPVNSDPHVPDKYKSSAKFRKPKITPRLNVSRAVTKVQEKDEKSSEIETIDENPVSSPIPIPIKNENLPESSTIGLFSPPRTPRAETPRDTSDSPGIIINHNIHQPPAPQSPFFPIPHQRIRTESLCSIKSTTVANLQPRKKVRTEDQKILDNKKESRERLSNKTIEKSQLRMFDMIYYNPTTNPMKPRTTAAKEKSPKKIDLTAELPPSPTQKETTAMPVPQLKLNANGELVLDETSLVVENEEQKKNRILLANTNVVYHDELTGTYGYYKRQQRTKEWPQEETIKFYRCLNTVGTDFSLMLNLFPNRSRRDLKLKFKKEEKTNPHLVDKALLNHSTFDIEELQRELDQEDEIRRKEAESRTSEVKELVKKKILKKQEAKAKAHQQDKAKIEKILCDGDLVLNSVNNPPSEKIQKSEKNEGKSKRAVKRKNMKIEPPMEFKKIVLSSQFSPSISVVELKSPINDENIEKPRLIPKQPTDIKSPVVVREMSLCAELHDSSNLVPTESNITVNSLCSEISSLPIMTKCENKITVMKEIEQDTLLSKTGKFLSESITDSYQELQENDDLFGEDNGCSLKSIKKEEPTEQDAVQEIPHAITPQSSGDIESISSQAVVIYQSSIAMSTESSALEELEVSQHSSNDPSNIADESCAEQIDNVESTPHEEPHEESPVDNESFLNSLDLERLVVVIKHVDGKDVYDIHETNGCSQELSDKPLNLPRHIVDLIVSAMTQDD